MKNLKLLIVEGNTKEHNDNFLKVGCIPQSENFSKHIKFIDKEFETDIVEPGDDESVFKIVTSLEKYDGIVLTGSALRVKDNSDEIKKHINFAKTIFKHEKKIFAACWGLQITVTAAGGKCRVAPKGAHIGIAQNIELTEEGKKHYVYSSKPHKFTTPAFNYDEVEIPPKNSVLLASDKINKFQAIHFNVGKSEVLGIQYHPEIPYDYMIKLIEYRSESLIENESFKNKNEIAEHINLIKKENSLISDKVRTLELKNWLNYLRKIN